MKRRNLSRTTASRKIKYQCSLYVIGSTIIFVVCHQIGLIYRVIRDENNGLQIGLVGSLAKMPGSLNVTSDENNGLQNGGVSSLSSVRRDLKMEKTPGSLNVIGNVTSGENNGLQNGGLRSSSSGGIKYLETTEPLPLLTLLILTYSKPKGLELLLRSLMDQELAQAKFEVVVVDNGCQPDTKLVYDHSLASNGTVSSKFLPLCDNPGYAVGNNKGAMMASPDSKYILFLNDDIQLSSPDFIENMILLAKAKPNAAAVGCKVVNRAGNELIEAGSIIFKDGSATGYGRGMKDDSIFRSDYSYPRPVDYVSGACLLIEKDVFMGYKHGSDGFGFDHERFPNYYEDTDLQLHIQHDLQKEVWLQPKSIARHEEHGSFGAEDSWKLMQKAAITFHSKWESALEKYHVPNPLAAGVDGVELDKRLLLAADLRARKTSVANILYIDWHAPYRTRGSGFGRSFDNLSMIAELGHRITLVTKVPEGDEKVIEEITDLGIEYYKGDLGSLVPARAGFYDVVIVSRPDTFNMLRDSVRSMYLKHPFTLVYDAEALVFRRDELRKEVMTVDGIQFPEENVLGVDDDKIVWKLERAREISLIKTADVVITVSDRESKAVSEMLPDGANVHTIGHVMDSSVVARKTFQDRQGILFVGAFHDQMHYNGDAIWYFLTEVYPLVIKKVKVPIPLKIVGRGIPQQLRDIVKMDDTISQHITFYESPDSIDRFLDESRVLIAPHLYGAGIQYKVSEALSNGLPVVMSRFTFDSFGKIPGCVGSDADLMKQCIIDVHGNEATWTTLQKQGFDFIDETHDRGEMMDEWSNVIDGSLALARNRNRAFMKAETAYGKAYPTLLKRRTQRRSGFQSFLEHYVLHGKKEGKSYSDSNVIWNGLVDDKFEIKEPTERCEEGERIYFKMYPDVAMNWKRPAFAHYKMAGKSEARTYVCISMLD